MFCLFYYVWFVFTCFVVVVVVGFHCRDHWNAFDFLIFAVYIFAILPLRIAIWVESESANNNRILAIAGHLYGVNTMLLTFRAFGSILETTKGVGTVQIAFFNIIGDAVVVVLHFLVITMAFSTTITKVFVAERTMVSKNTPEKQPWVFPRLVFVAVLINALIKREYVQKSTKITKSQQLLNNSNLLPFCIEVNLISVSIRTPCVDANWFFLKRSPCF